MPPAIDKDGTIYVANLGEQILAINPDGTKKWTSHAQRRNSSPSIGPDGNIYLASVHYHPYTSEEYGQLRCFDSKGNIEWIYKVDKSLAISSPAIGKDGTIYIGSRDNKLHAVNPDGSQKWVCEIGAYVYTPTIGTDGTIYVGSGGNDDSLYAIYSECGGLADSPWPMYKRDVRHSGRQDIEIATHESPRPANPLLESQKTDIDSTAANNCISGEASPGPFLVNSGNFYHTQSDLSIPCLGPDLEITRYYNTHDLYAGPFGYGWNMNYTSQLVLTEDTNGTQTASVRMGNGVRLKFTRQQDGSFASPPGKNDILVENNDGTYTLNGGCEMCTQKPTPAYTFNSDGSLHSIADMNGNTLEIGYNGNARIASATDANSRTLNFSYGANGRVSSITDFSDPPRTWSYDYDGQDNLTSVTYPDGSQILYAYDENQNLISITDAKGNTVSSLSYNNSQKLESFTEQGGTYEVSYDPESKLTSKTDPEGNVFQFGFDDNGNILNKTTPQENDLSLTWDQNINVTGRENLRGVKTAYTYDERGNILSVSRDAVADGLNATTSYTYDPRFDKQASVTDTLGRTTQMDYDEQGNLLSRQRPIGTSTYDYDAIGNLIRVTDPDGYVREMEYDANGYLTRTYIPGSSPVIETTYTYDQRGNVHTKTDPNGHTTSYSYDAMDRLTSLTYPDGNSTSFAYDVNGNLVSRTNPRDVTTVYEYDAYNQLTRKIEANGTSLERITQYDYDARGNLISVTDPLSNTTTYAYDNRNRVHTATTTLGQTVQFNYDPSGNLVSKTDPNGNAISYSYDALNRLSKVTDAEGHVTEYSYDKMGNMISVQDANNHTATSKTYDANNRLTSTSDALGYGQDITHTDGGRILSKTDVKDNVTEYVYNATTARLSEIQYPGGRTEIYTYDLAGNILSVSDNTTGITVSYTYDARNRVKTETQLGETITYDYDAIGNRITMQVSNLGTYSYTYDVLNRLTSITNPYDEITEFSYLANDLRQQITYANNATTQYSYDEANRPQSIIHAYQNGTVIGSFDYAYDNAANRVSVTNHNGETITYSYDNTYKLLEASYPDETIAFTYDGVGNRQTRTDSDGTTNYIYDNANRLSDYTLANGTIVSLTYDDNGNISTKTIDSQVTTYTYDSKDQLHQIEYPDGTVNTFTYDPLGRKVQTTNSQGVRRYLYDGDNVIAETMSLPGSQFAYDKVYTQGLRLDDLISGSKVGQTELYLRDGLNSVRFLLSDDETVLAEYQYEPYGKIRSQTGMTDNQYTYTGRRMLTDSDMMYYRSRYYDPMTGRFVKKDSYTGNIDDPLSLNRYVYVKDNPVNFVDPMGLVNWSLVGRGALLTTLGVGGAIGTVPLAAICPPAAAVTGLGAMGSIAWGISDMTAGLAGADEETEETLNEYESVGTSPVSGATTFVGTALTTGSTEQAQKNADLAAATESIIVARPNDPISTTDAAFKSYSVVENYIGEDKNQKDAYYYYMNHPDETYVPMHARPDEICQMND